jgi:2-octaprenyl-6-methoxyphenol hydroxylase
MSDHQTSKKPHIIKTDVIIIGGGQSGLTLAALLGDAQIDTVCIDRDDPKLQQTEQFDLRTTAISFGSTRVLDAAGVWDTLLKDACPIKNIDILDSQSPILLKFLIDSVEQDAFGWIINNRDMRKALQERIETLDSVQHIAPDGAVRFEAFDDYIEVELASGQIMHGQLLVGADGRQSFVRQYAGIQTRKWAYNQHAVICTIAHENSHDNNAIEHFKAEGPFAILPMPDGEDGTHRSSLVWTEHFDGSRHAKQSSVLSLSEEAFNLALNERFPDFYGKVWLASKRRAYPLGLEHAIEYIAPRLCLVADAAHAIHPIAGQGLNMGMRDIAGLTEILVAAKAKNQSLGASENLALYQRRRRFDNMAMAAVTDGLVKVFGVSFPPFRAVRQMGLMGIERFNPIKKFFMKQAMGTSGLLPDLIKKGKPDQ